MCMRSVLTSNKWSTHRSRFANRGGSSGIVTMDSFDMRARQASVSCCDNQGSDGGNSRGRLSTARLSEYHHPSWKKRYPHRVAHAPQEIQISSTPGVSCLCREVPQATQDSCILIRLTLHLHKPAKQMSVATTV